METGSHGLGSCLGLDLETNVQCMVPHTRRILSGLVLFGILFGGTQAWGQEGASSSESLDEEVPDSLIGTWRYDATARLNASQAAYKDWEEGAGTGSLAFTAGVGGQAQKRGDHWIQSHELRLAYGLIDQEGRESRKSEDQIRWDSSLRYEGTRFFRLFQPTIATNFRTQFAPGFDYTENPFEGEVPDTDERLTRDLPIQKSAFFAPAYITESIGLTYEPFADFTVRAGGASKQTIVLEKDFRVLYGVSDEDATRVEAGAELASAFDRQLTENIRYRSHVNLFFSFNQVENPPDALWENTIYLQVNDWLSTDLEFVTRYDKDIVDAIQLKETISVGLSFTLL